MPTKAEANTVYAAGLIQGIALVTFPAASTIFTEPSQYGLSNTQYGTMFLPQVVTAITGVLLGGQLAQRFGIKRVFLAGLAADLASMLLLIVSQFFTSDQAVAYTLLLVARGRRGEPACPVRVRRDSRSDHGLSFTLARKSPAEAMVPASTA